MPYSLAGRKVLITGGSRGLGAVIAQRFAAEGSDVAINYANNRQPAEELADKIAKNFSVKAIVIKADAGNTAECEQAVQSTIDGLGGLDIIIGNAGWTRFSKFDDLHATSEEDWDKCYAVNVKGQLALFRAALPTFNANADGGAFIVTSSVAGIAATGSSLPYSVTKAAGLQLVKCLATTQGPKVRVNAVLPGLLLTDWGNKYPPEAIRAIKDKAVLKQETLLDDCAEAFVALAKNTSATGVQYRVDSGLFP